MEANFENIITYNQNEAFLSELKSQCFKLIVIDPSDKKGYEACKEKKKEVRKVFSLIESRRKELKEDALRFGQAVDGKANALKAYCLESQKHLEEQMKIVEEEEARIKREAEEAMQRKQNERIEKAMQVGWHVSPVLLANMNDETFDEEYRKALDVHEENKRIQEENERLRAQYEEEQRIKSEALEAENRELREAEQARIRKEAEEASRLRAEKEAKEKEEREELARQAAADAKARKAAADKKLYDEVKAKFPTLPDAWAEIVRLMRA